MGLAVLASLAAKRTNSLQAAGESAKAALTGGYHLAFLTGAIFAVAGALLSAFLLREGAPIGAHAAEEPAHSPAYAESD